MADIRFENVRKEYRMGEVVIRAADDVSFQVKNGEFCILLGPSGAGKTTILNLLGGMDTATSGKMLFAGKNIAAMNDLELTDYRRYKIGFVFQFYNLIPNLTALENVELAKQVCKSPLEPEEALRIVGLQDRIHNFPAQLSGGEQQRVAIARAIDHPGPVPGRAVPKTKHTKPPARLPGLAHRTVRRLKHPRPNHLPCVMLRTAAYAIRCGVRAGCWKANGKTTTKPWSFRLTAWVSNGWQPHWLTLKSSHNLR